MADTENLPNTPILQVDWDSLRATVEDKTSWLGNGPVRTQIVSSVLEQVEHSVKELTAPPKKPSYWIARATNTALRDDLRRQGIQMPNVVTDEVYKKIEELVARRIPEEMRDEVINHIFDRMKREVRPIENLEHWTNKIIFHCKVDSIRLDTGKSDVFKWQVIRDTAGSKEDVDRELADHYKRAEAGEVDDVEFLPSRDTRNAGDEHTESAVQVSTSSTNWSSLMWDSGTTTMATTAQGTRSPDISAYDNNGNMVSASSTTSTSGWSVNGGLWSRRMPITIDHTKVSGSGTLTNFPLLFSVTSSSEFKSTANGGYVALSNGTDIFFTASDGVTKINHELERYTATSGEVIAWVNVPNVYTSTNTIIYAYYGNANSELPFAVTT